MWIFLSKNAFNSELLWGGGGGRCVCVNVITHIHILILKLKIENLIIKHYILVQIFPFKISKTIKKLDKTLRNVLTN